MKKVVPVGSVKDVCLRECFKAQAEALDPARRIIAILFRTL